MTLFTAQPISPTRTGSRMMHHSRQTGGREEECWVCRLEVKEAFSSPTFLPFSSSSSWGGLGFLWGLWYRDPRPLDARVSLALTYHLTQQDGSRQPPQPNHPWMALRPSREAWPPAQAPVSQNRVDFYSTCYPKVPTAQDGGSAPLSPRPPFCCEQKGLRRMRLFISSSLIFDSQNPL